MDAERNTVVPVPSVYPSVCPVPVLCQNVWTSHFFEGHHSIFLALPPLQNCNGTLWVGHLIQGVGKFFKCSHLSLKR